MEADASEQVVGKGFIEQGAVGVASLYRVVAKRKPTGVWRQCRVSLLPRIGWAAGAAIRRLVVGQASTYRVEFNVAIAGKDVVSTIDKTDFVAADLPIACRGARGGR